MIGPDQETLDKLFEDFSRPGAPGLAMGIIHQSELIAACARGLADVERRVVCSMDSNFRLASLTKQFTATAVLILRQRMKLSLDAEIGRFLPALGSRASGVTIRHLLTHTSGLPDYEDLIPPHMKRPLKDQDVCEIIAREPKSNFPAGTAFRYSNSGYALLALIIETVSGESFATFLRSRIFEPLGMMNTVAHEAGISSVIHRAIGYSQTSDGFQQTDQSLTSAVLGDGGVYSSIADLVKWDQALYTDQLVSPTILREAFSPAAHPTDIRGFAYGFGWYVDNRRPADPHHWHNGSTCGFSTRIERFPSRQLTLILLINRRDVDVTELARKALADCHL